MKLTFNSQEIEQALISYVAYQGIDLSNKDVSVNMTAGRGPNGHTAELNITTIDDAKQDLKVVTEDHEVVVKSPYTEKEKEEEEEPSPFLEDDVEPEDATALKFGED